MSAFCQHVRVEHGGREHGGSEQGPLAGLSFAVKDVFAIAGVASCYGNPRWLDTHPPAARTAPVVQRLLDAGARLAGLAISDELALSLTGENAHYGTPVNPRCPERVPGGSSSGSAVAVASEQVDFALGTDTGGSVRVPASHTGIFGFRPTHGAVPLDGVLPLAPRFDTVGWFARDAALLERVGHVLLPEAPSLLPEAPGASAPGEGVHGERARGEGTDGEAAPKALVLYGNLAEYLDDAARTPFARAASALARALGVPLLESVVPAPARWLEAYLTLQNLEAARLHRAFLERHRESFGSLIRRRFDAALATTPERAERAEAIVAELMTSLAGTLTRGAWLVLPSAPGAAPLRGLSDDAVDAFTGRGLTLAATASLCGVPQLSLPLARSEGCPFGVSLLAPRGADRDLLAAARTLARLPTLQESS
jgi:amidase